MKLQIILEPSVEGGYTAYVPALPGCISEGDTKEDTLNNIQEAIELYLESVEDDQSFSPNAEKVEIAVWAKYQVLIMINWSQHYDGMGG